MDVFDLTARIALDTSEYENGLGKSKKSMSEYRSDVAKLAAAHKKSGMDSSAAWKQAYSEIDKSQYETSEKSRETTEGMGKDWTAVAGKLKTVAKIIAGSAIVKGFADMTKASVDAYSSFEQLEGGAKKIFNEMDFAAIALDANKAYETLGLSANRYLSVINDVGASFAATMGDEAGYETAKTGLGPEAKQSATSTLQGYLDGLNSRKGDIFAVFDEIRRKAESALDSVDSVKSAGSRVGGYATGLNYVPYDNFPALLHRGEAVLTAPEARMWRNGEAAVPAVAGTGGITIVQNINVVPQTPAEFGAATEAYFEQARWML